MVRCCGTPVEGVDEVELVEDPQRRGVDGVAAEVAEEVGVLLEHDDVDAGAREQQPEHRAGGSAAGDDAGGRVGQGSVMGSHVASGRVGYADPATIAASRVGPHHLLRRPTRVVQISPRARASRTASCRLPTPSLR